MILGGQSGGAKRADRKKEEEKEKEEEEEEEEEDILPPGRRFDIRSDRSRYFSRFRMRGRETDFIFRQPAEGENHLVWFEGAVRDVLTHLTQSCEGHDYVGMTLSAPSFSQGPVWLSFRPARDIHPADIWQLINSVVQSSREFRIDGDACRMTTCVVRGVEGGSGIALSHEAIAKKSILTITNSDNLCLPRSLVVARAHAERGEIRSGPLHRQWCQIRNSLRGAQYTAAVELVRQAGVTIPARGCGLREIQHFQEYLAHEGIAIIVYEFLTFGKRVPALYNGRNSVLSVTGKINHTLYILYYERSKHYQPVLNLAAALGSRGFCTFCNSRYTRVIEHRCKQLCERCKSAECNGNKNSLIYCNACNRSYFGESCLSNHRRQGSARLKGQTRSIYSVCNVLKICRECLRMYKTTDKKNHICGISFCMNCRQTRPTTHQCFIAPLKGKNQNKKVDGSQLAFVFYDFETQQHTQLHDENSTRIHEPNLCVAQRVCMSCIEIPNIDIDCVACGKREFVFSDNPVGELVKLALSGKFKKTVCIAHNARGFDAQFILRYLIEEEKTQMPSLIMNGTKIISMKIGNVIFLDSLNYLPMSLSALPKAFGFADDVIKGTFPHLFNTPEYQNYRGSLPASHFYSPDTMFAADRARFLEWHKKESNRTDYQFDFAQEFVRYCRTDVTVLRRACLAFRKLLTQCGSVCPFTEACTIASTCMRVFRKNFLRKDCIAILPPGGYRWADKQSRKAVAWLVWLEHTYNRVIAHAGRSREYRPPGGLPAVDGYYEDNGVNHTLQFHGCYWHGCPRCYRVNRDARLKSGDSMEERYERTILISGRIRSRGYALTEIWECDFDKLLENDANMAAYIKNHPMVKQTPLEPRDAFFGGRTENFVSLYDIKEGEKIHYVDVCSLYPWVCKTGKFPVGHPRLYVGDECRELVGVDNNLSTIEGLVKCVVLAPRDLYLPVLPVRMHGKLLFALCKACCTEMNAATNCAHDDPTEREFDGTWVVDELRKAVSLGYKVTRIEEIWQYNVTRYDPATRQGGHFAEFINTFLKIKQEASGPPAECNGDERLIEQFIAQYESVEGISLNRDELQFNSGLRCLAKLLLNSFWGKFGQRYNLAKTDIVSSRAQLMDLLTSPEIEVTGMLPVNHKIMYVNYVSRRESISPSSTSNAVIAAYTTAQARLKLYSYLEGLGRRILYCDTDSCIYVSREGSNEYEPPVGQYLGDLTDELGEYGPGSYITSFVSGGPKFYAYIVRKSDGTTIEKCKVKGITLNFANSRHVNYAAIRSFVTGDRNEPIVLKFDAIRRTEFHRVVTREEKKSCKPVNVKRQRHGSYCTVPYGYRTAD